jgi:hypothetical protein
MFIDFNDKYELYNSIRGIGVCKEIYSDVQLSNFLAANISYLQNPSINSCPTKDFLKGIWALVCNARITKANWRVVVIWFMTGARELKKRESGKNGIR